MWWLVWRVQDLKSSSSRIRWPYLSSMWHNYAYLTILCRSAFGVTYLSLNNSKINHQARFQTIKNSWNCLVRSFNLFLSSDVNSCPMSFRLTEGVFFAFNLVLFHSIGIVGRKGQTKVSFYEQISLWWIKKSVILLKYKRPREECTSFHVQVSPVGCSTEYKIRAWHSLAYMPTGSNSILTNSINTEYNLLDKSSH